MTEVALQEVPFWSDDFDMDLPKLFPDARRLLGDLGDIELVTTGRPDQRTGRLNHPSVWNSDRAMLAFFGFRSAVRPSHYYTNEPEIRCTTWEAFRDAWPHSYLIVVERRPIWDTFALRAEFNALLYDLRNYPGLASKPDALKARVRVASSFSKAISAFGDLVNRYPDVRRKAG